MRILLTGATGFLGSALARYWYERGHELLLLGRQASSAYRIANVVVQWPLQRVADDAQLQSVVREFSPEAVVHTACAYGRRGESASELLDTNVRLGLRLIEALPQKSQAPITLINAGTSLIASLNAYALSKQQFSEWGAMLARQQPERLQFIDLHLQQIYGPQDDDSKFTTHVLNACRTNSPFLALTAGEQRRDFIHVDDVVRAVDTVLARRADIGTADVIDVGSGQAVAMRDFVELVHRVTQSRTRLDFGAVPYRVGEVMHCQADTRRLQQLGWNPMLDLEQGLRQVLHVQAASAGVTLMS